jgi:DNA ligase-1
MTFRHLSEYFQKLEATTLRNKMTEILSSLFKEAGKNEIDKLCYLLQGRVAPLYEAIEFGMADRMMIRAIAQGLDIDAKQVMQEFKREGDLGQAVEKIKSDSTKHKTYNKKISIVDVYEKLYKVATSGGKGSQDEKIKLLGNLLAEVDPLSARYIVRITLCKLRLGFSDMTILDSLSWMLKGTKELRAEIEKAYNVRPDLGFISRTMKEKGIKGLANAAPQVGTPILMARAERMSSGADIIKKIGKCAVEPKYDGFRIQVHYKKIKNQKSKIKTTAKNLKLMKEKDEDVRLFSRNLENVTHMYPDIVEGVGKQIEVKEAIFEGEAIAYNPKTGEYLPFQETVQRKRKYNIEAKAKEIPLRLFAFDLLFVNGENLLHCPYTQRRKKLEKLIKKGDGILIASETVVDDPQKLEVIFQDSVTRGLEGVMAKKLEGTYRAGARDFNWIKYKRSYAGKLNDTIDAVVMGYDVGQGKRTGFGIGDFLIGILDEKKDKFVTIAKIGTGLTDEEWKELKTQSSKLKTAKMPQNYDVDKMMVCDVWMMPSIVVEIRADEITRSPVHTAGRLMGPSKSGNAQEVKEAGFALRFPRLERFRSDKNPKDATTLVEVKRMFGQQGKAK